MHPFTVSWDIGGTQKPYLANAKIVLMSPSTSSECAAEGQVFHCKLRHQGCSSAQKLAFHTNSGTKAAVLLGMNSCGRFLLLSAPHFLFSIWTDLKRSLGYQHGGEESDLATWALRTSPQGLNISSIRVFQLDQRSGNPNHPHCLCSVRFSATI